MPIYCYSHHSPRWWVLILRFGRPPRASPSFLPYSIISSFSSCVNSTCFKSQSHHCISHHLITISSSSHHLIISSSHDGKSYRNRTLRGVNLKPPKVRIHQGRVMHLHKKTYANRTHRGVNQATIILSKMRTTFD